MEKTSKVFEIYDEKKHSVRYNEVDDGKPSVASSIYFSKELLGRGTLPMKIRITVEDAS